MAKKKAGGVDAKVKATHPMAETKKVAHPDKGRGTAKGTRSKKK